jgi:hypothetical protein
MQTTDRDSPRLLPLRQRLDAAVSLLKKHRFSTVRVNQDIGINGNHFDEVNLA